MRWFFTNAHPLREALPLIGETIVGGDADTEVGHPEMRWLRALVAEYAPTCPPSVDVVTWAFREAARANRLTMEEANPNRYPLAKVLRALNPDVVVLTPLEQLRSGFWTSPVLNWRNSKLNRGAVVGIGRDPDTLAAAGSGRWRPCSCTPGHVSVYVTDHPPSARKSATERRTAFFRATDAEGSARAVLAAVRNAMGGNFTPGKAAKVWGLD